MRSFYINIKEKILDFGKDFGKEEFLSLFIYLLSILIFFIILINRSIDLIRNISLYVRYKPHFALPFFAVFLFIAFLIKKPKIKNAVIFFLVLMLFALSLGGIWASTNTESYLISGLIPFSDARFQYAGVLKLLDYGELNGTTSRRPIFAEVLALFMAVSNRNLQLALAMMVLISAISTWTLIVEAEYQFGQVSAILFLSLLILFYAKFAGTTLTENLGFSLGVLSLTFLLRAIRQYNEYPQLNQKYYLFGVFIFSLAQNVRPGAILTIPLLISYAGFLFRKGSRNFNWKVAGSSVVAGALPFLINILHFQIFGMKGTFPMSNMGYSLYGFVRGGKLWSQIYADNPGFLQLSIIDRNSYLFSEIFKNITQHPENIISGYIKEFSVLFGSNNQSGLFSTIQFDYHLPNQIFLMMVMILLAVGVVLSLINLKKSAGQFIIVILFGYLLSVPFASSYQAIYMRLFAASLPYFYLIPAYGLGQIIQKFSIRERVENKNASQEITRNGFSLWIIFIIVFSPLLLLPFVNRNPARKISCQEGLQEEILFYHPNSTLFILEDENITSVNWAPITYQYKFRDEISNICCKDELAFFRGLQAPVSLINSVDTAGLHNYILIDPEMLPKKKGWVQLCGTTTDILGRQDESGIFYPEELFLLE